MRARHVVLRQLGIKREIELVDLEWAPAAFAWAALDGHGHRFFSYSLLTVALNRLRASGTPVW